MMRHRVNQSRLANWSLSVALVGAVAMGVYYTALNHSMSTKTRIVHSFKMEPPPDQLKAGEKFRVTVDITVFEVCPYDLRWTLVDEHEEAVALMVESRKVYPGLGNQTVVLDHYMPSHVKPGAYKYITQVYDICNDRVKLVPASITPVVVIP